jgi:hypothetical protein
MQRAGKTEDRQRQGGARSLAKPKIKVEKRARLERLQHQPVALLGGAM